MAKVTLVPPALATAQPVGPQPGQSLDVIAVLQVMDALGCAGHPRLWPAVVGTPVSRARGTCQPPQHCLILVHRLNELLPVPQQLLGPLGELFILGLLADVIDEFPKSRLLQPEKDHGTYVETESPCGP